MDVPTGDYLCFCVETLTEVVFDRGFKQQLWTEQNKMTNEDLQRSENYNVLWGNMDQNPHSEVNSTSPNHRLFQVMAFKVDPTGKTVSDSPVRCTSIIDLKSDFNKSWKSLDLMSPEEIKQGQMLVCREDLVHYGVCCVQPDFIRFACHQAFDQESRQNFQYSTLDDLKMDLIGRALSEQPDWVWRESDTDNQTVSFYSRCLAEFKSKNSVVIQSGPKSDVWIQTQGQIGLGLRASRDFNHHDVITKFAVIETAEGRQVSYSDQHDAEAAIVQTWQKLYPKQVYPIQESGIGKRIYLLVPAIECEVGVDSLGVFANDSKQPNSYMTSRKVDGTQVFYLRAGKKTGKKNPAIKKETFITLDYGGGWEHRRKEQRAEQMQAVIDCMHYIYKVLDIHGEKDGWMCQIQFQGPGLVVSEVVRALRVIGSDVLGGGKAAVEDLDSNLKIILSGAKIHVGVEGPVETCVHKLTEANIDTLSLKRLSKNLTGLKRGPKKSLAKTVAQKRSSAIRNQETKNKRERERTSRFPSRKLVKQ